MTNYSGNQDKDRQKTDEAWAKLQSKLSTESVNPDWALWGQKTQTISEKLNSMGNNESAPNSGTELEPIFEQDKIKITSNKAGRRSQRKRMTRRRKWSVVAASVAVFTIVLATPIGNTAMASILNQFRMQEVTVVDEGDLNNIFNQVTENGTVGEAMNKFGTFINTTGAYYGELPVEELQETLGYAPPNSSLLANVKTVYVRNSSEVTMNLNIEEVNKTMKRLGAEHLLPEAIDGKPITFHIPEIVNYDLSSDNEKWANLSQMNTPVLTVDPSIKVQEALEAVIHFPLLPDYLKTSLQQSSILSGEIPMPLIKGDRAEQITVNGTSVIMDQYDYSQGLAFSAVWVQKGQLYELNGGSVYTSREQFLEILQELIQS